MRRCEGAVDLATRRMIFMTHSFTCCVATSFGKLPCSRNCRNHSLRCSVQLVWDSCRSYLGPDNGAHRIPGRQRVVACVSTLIGELGRRFCVLGCRCSQLHPDMSKEEQAESQSNLFGTVHGTKSPQVLLAHRSPSDYRRAEVSAMFPSHVNSVPLTSTEA